MAEDGKEAPYCVEDLFEIFDEVIPSESTSSSVFVFGTLKPGILRTTTYPLAVLKMGLPPTSRNNSLDTEANIYTLIRDHILPLTPHVLAGMYAAVCSDEGLRPYKNSPDAAKRSLYRSWFALRLASGEWESKYSRKERRRFQVELRDRGYNPMDARDLVMHSSMTFDRTLIHFVLTPRIGDVSLATFFSQEEWGLARGDLEDSDILSLVIQGAQALAALAKHKIVHHDLHGGNVYVQKLTEQEPIAYTFPTKCVHISRMRLLVFDFDHASAAALPRNRLLDTADLCKSIGECNTYEKNFDWYTFLEAVEHYCKEARIHTPKIVREILKGSNRKDDAWPGHPCKCLEESKKTGVCTRCALKKKFLNSMPTPASVFRTLTR